MERCTVASELPTSTAARMWVVTIILVESVSNFASRHGPLSQDRLISRTYAVFRKAIRSERNSSSSTFVYAWPPLEYFFRIESAIPS